MTSREQRVEALEQAVGVDQDGDAPPLVVRWREDETVETRAAYRKAAAWYRRHGWPSEVRVCWADGSEVTPP